MRLHDALVLEEDAERRLRLLVEDVCEPVVVCVVADGRGEEAEHVELRQLVLHAACQHLVRYELRHVDCVPPVVVRDLVVRRADLAEEPEERLGRDLELVEEVEGVEHPEDDLEEADSRPLRRVEVDREDCRRLLVWDDELLRYDGALALVVRDVLLQLHLDLAELCDVLELCLLERDCREHGEAVEQLHVLGQYLVRAAHLHDAEALACLAQQREAADWLELRQLRARVLHRVEDVLVSEERAGDPAQARRRLEVSVLCVLVAVLDVLDDLLAVEDHRPALRDDDAGKRRPVHDVAPDVDKLRQLAAVAAGEEDRRPRRVYDDLRVVEDLLDDVSDGLRLVQCAAHLDEAAELPRQVERRLVEARVVQRDAAEDVERLHHLDVVLVERAPVDAVDHLRDAADLAPVVVDRHREDRPRPEASGEVDRLVEARVVVRVGDVDEVARLRGVPDDAAVDRQPERLVEPAVEARDELLLGRVDEEERAPLRVEQLARALHDRRDEDVDVEDAADDLRNLEQGLEAQRKVAARDALVARNAAEGRNGARDERDERLELVRLDRAKRRFAAEDNGNRLRVEVVRDSEQARAGRAVDLQVVARQL